MVFHRSSNIGEQKHNRFFNIQFPSSSIIRINYLFRYIMVCKNINDAGCMGHSVAQWKIMVANQLGAISKE